MLALLGLCIGSFLNVVIHRLPLMLEREWSDESAELLGVEAEVRRAADAVDARARAALPAAHPIRWNENMPVLSYLVLARPLRGLQHPHLGALSVDRDPDRDAVRRCVGWRFGAQPPALLWCGFVAVLVALAGIDWDTTLLPDDLTLPLLWAGLVASALGWTHCRCTDALWGAVAGYLSLWTVYWLSS